MKDKSVVYIDDVVSRLHVSRNYVHQVILPVVRNEMVHGRVEIDETELRQWLMDTATFSRQTKFVSSFGGEDIEYCKLLSSHRIKFKSPSETQRNQLPHRKVKPFDYWDKELVFPDDIRFSQSETFYRAMFKCAAVKIKLGSRKTLFYAPAFEKVMEMKNSEDHDFRFIDYLPDINSSTGKLEKIYRPVLLPAIDAEYDNVSYHSKEYVSIRINGKQEDMENVVRTLRESNLIDIEDINEVFNGRSTRVLQISNKALKNQGR